MLISTTALERHPGIVVARIDKYPTTLHLAELLDRQTFWKCPFFPYLLQTASFAGPLVRGYLPYLHKKGLVWWLPRSECSFYRECRHALKVLTRTHECSRRSRPGWRERHFPRILLKGGSLLHDWCKWMMLISCGISRWLSWKTCPPKPIRLGLQFLVLFFFRELVNLTRVWIFILHSHTFLVTHIFRFHSTPPTSF